MHKKRGFELSVSFLVVFILGTVMLILGLALGMKVSCYSVYTGDRIFEIIENEIADVMKQGKVTIYPSQIFLKDEVGRFGIGVLNIKENGWFASSIVCSKVIMPDGSSRECNDNVTISYFRNNYIEHNEYTVFRVTTNIKNAEEITYILDVCICEVESEDGTCVGWHNNEMDCREPENISNLYESIKKVYVHKQDTGVDVFDLIC